MQLIDSQSLDIRTCGINLNHWYVVAKTEEVQSKPLAITLWKQAIVLFRDTEGKIHALEDLCPHRHVKLSSGEIAGDFLECAYHGWQFDSAGRCTNIPLLNGKTETA